MNIIPLVLRSCHLAPLVCLQGPDDSVLGSAEFYDLATQQWTMVRKDNLVRSQISVYSQKIKLSPISIAAIICPPPPPPPGEPPQGGQDGALHEPHIWSTHHHRSALSLHLF